MSDTTNPPPLKPKTFYHRAATFCLWSPFIGIIITFFGRMSPPPQTSVEAAANATYNAAVPVLGFIAGIVALSGVKRHGSAGILWKAVTGMSIFLLMVLMAIPSFLKAKEAARQRHEQRYEQLPP
jgi:hypothetical protein